jgi:thiol:disulfide interchange protein DsbD
MKRFAGAIVVFSLASLPAGAQAPAKADVTPLVETMAAAPGTDVRAALSVRLPDGLHANSNKPRDPSLIPVTLRFDALPPGVSVTEVVFPEATDLVQQGAYQPLRVFDGQFVIGAVFHVAADAASGERSIAATLRYQACNDVACFLPVRIETAWAFTVGRSTGPTQHGDVFKTVRFGTGEPPDASTDATSTGAASAGPAPIVLPMPGSVPTAGDDAAALDAFVDMGSTTGYQGAGDFLTFIRNAEQGVKEKGMFEGRGPLAIVLLVLLGGLALNLTPCVLPMIPINLAIIGAGAQAGSRSRGFLLGAAYGAAMAVVYGALGLVVILTASTFGTINSYWWFNAGVAAVFVVLALAMFDVIIIDFSRFSSRVRVEDGNRGSVAVAFGMGAVAALLAGACVAPVVIQVVLFSSDLYQAGTPAALALPFLLGVGMAIPWPVAGAGIAALPRPGAWMVRIKQVFGVVILATAAYYGYEAYAILSNRWVDPSEVSSSVQAKLKAGWHSSIAEGLAVARRENKPVLIDLWATWCKNCLVMDKTTLEDPAVTAALDRYVKVKFEADPPDDPNVAKVMQRLEARGLPTYVILNPN